MSYIFPFDHWDKMIKHKNKLENEIKKTDNNKLNRKYFCVSCGAHSYLSQDPDKCPSCKEPDVIVEVKD
jgi:rubrerythrin